MLIWKQRSGCSCACQVLINNFLVQRALFRMAGRQSSAARSTGTTRAERTSAGRLPAAEREPGTRPGRALLGREPSGHLRDGRPAAAVGPRARVGRARGRRPHHRRAGLNGRAAALEAAALWRDVGYAILISSRQWSRRGCAASAASSAADRPGRASAACGEGTSVEVPAARASSRSSPGARPGRGGRPDRATTPRSRTRARAARWPRSAAISERRRPAQKAAEAMRACFAKPAAAMLPVERRGEPHGHVLARRPTASHRGPVGTSSSTPRSPAAL